MNLGLKFERRSGFLHSHWSQRGLWSRNLGLKFERHSGSRRSPWGSPTNLSLKFQGRLWTVHSGS